MLQTSHAQHSPTHSRTAYTTKKQKSHRTKMLQYTSKWPPNPAATITLLSPPPPTQHTGWGLSLTSKGPSVQIPCTLPLKGILKWPSTLMMSQDLILWKEKVMLLPLPNLLLPPPHQQLQEETPSQDQCSSRQGCNSQRCFSSSASSSSSSSPSASSSSSFDVGSQRDLLFRVK